MTAPQNEFVFGIKGSNGYKWYDISQLDRYDELLREDNRVMWEKIRRGYRKEIVEVFTPIQKKYESEPEMIKVAKLPLEDTKKKFG